MNDKLKSKLMTNNWNISGLILEGICGSGKSTILHSLLRSDRFVEKSFYSSLVLSEHQTQRVLEQKEREGRLVPGDHISLLDQHVTYLKNLKTRLDNMQWCRKNRTNMRIPYILERFHFTHVAHYPHLSWEDVREIDLRLSKLNCNLCLLVIDDSVMEKRIIHGQDEAWENYLSTIGKTNEEIIQHYTAQQEVMINLADRSALDTLVINTTEISVETTLTRILNFWKAI